MNARATLGACMSANALLTAKGRNTKTMRSSTARCTAGHHENCCKCMKVGRAKGYTGGNEEYFKSSSKKYKAECEISTHVLK